VFGPTGAAAKLGVPRSTLESKIGSLKIDKNRCKDLGVKRGSGVRVRQSRGTFFSPLPFHSRSQHYSWFLFLTQPSSRSRIVPSGE
jgi:hypothetical protein